MKYQVLIVEDEATLLRGIIRGLSSLKSLNVKGCSNVDTALKYLKYDPPDLLVTDLNLPGKTGFDLISELQKSSIFIPIIVTTAYRTAYADQIEQHSSLTVLEKPVPLQKLRSLISEKLFTNKYVSPGPFQLTDYLQLASMGRHSLNIAVELESGALGTIVVVDGDIWNAFIGDIEGMDALKRMLFEPVFRMEYHNLEEHPVTRMIEKPAHALFLELAQIKDEEAADALDALDHPDADDDQESFGDLDALDQFAAQTLDEDARVAATALCAELLDGCSEGIVCCVGELNTGDLAGHAHRLPDHPDALIYALTGMAADLFKVRSVTRLEERLAEHGGVPVVDVMQEITVQTAVWDIYLKPVGAMAFIVAVKKGADANSARSTLLQGADGLGQLLGL